MISQSSSSLSSGFLLIVITTIGVVLYAGFAFLVAHSKNMEVRRRWRFSILSGVFFGAVISILFGLASILAVFGDENELGYMTVFRYPSNSLALFTGIVQFLSYPVLLSLPLVLLVTFGTYWKQLGMGDLFINQLLHPVMKHPSDQSPNSIFDRVKTFLAKLIDL